jgi:hypothetical protein
LYDSIKHLNSLLLVRPITGRLRDAAIRVYDEAGNVIERDECKGDFKVW